MQMSASLCMHDQSGIMDCGRLPNRHTRRVCSRDRWIAIVDALLERDENGHLVHRELSLGCAGGVLTVRVGTPEWQTYLRTFIIASGFRMCWEPKPKPRVFRPEPSLW